MRLILHIGTHKTGTSSLQQFLKLNERALEKRGIYYARRPHAKNSNYLAKLIASKRISEAESFLRNSIKRANAAQAHTLLISGESFYAMTKFFHELEKRPSQDYWRSEAALVRSFFDILPPDMPKTVFVTFRRQDYFLESLYSQIVKSRSVAFSIDEFKEFMSEPFDYWRHMEIWSAVIPDCCACTYETVSGKINNKFLKNVLKLTNIEEFASLDFRMNERISRDVLEYKRILNRRKTSAVERRLNSMVCTKLSEAFPDCGKYKDYLSKDARSTLLGELEQSNSFLVKKYGLEPFPSISSYQGNSASYFGLSADNAIEIADHHNRIKWSLKYQKEKLGLIAARIIRRRLPLLLWLVPIGRLIVGRYLVANRHYKIRPWGAALSD